MLKSENTLYNKKKSNSTYTKNNERVKAQSRNFIHSQVPRVSNSVHAALNVLTTQ